MKLQKGCRKKKCKSKGRRLCAGPTRPNQATQEFDLSLGLGLGLDFWPFCDGLVCPVPGQSFASPCCCSASRPYLCNPLPPFTLPYEGVCHLPATATAINLGRALGCRVEQAHFALAFQKLFVGNTNQTV